MRTQRQDARRNDIGSSSIPTGYVAESTLVSYVSKRAFSVPREAQVDYAVGTPLILLVGGKQIPAAVQKQAYNGTITTVWVTIGIDNSLIGVFRDTSQSYNYGVDVNSTTALYHCNTSSLYDSGPKGNDVNSSAFTKIGSPILVTSGVPDLFGPSCWRFDGTHYYGVTGNVFNVFSNTSTPWCLEGWFYGALSGNVVGGYYGNGYGGAGLGFNGNYPRMWNEMYSAQYAQSSIICPSTSWTHVAWCYDLTNTYIFVGGAPGLTYSGSMIDSNNYLFYATGSPSGNGAGALQGYMKEMRFTYGDCVYRKPFTPPTKPFGPDFR